MDEKHSHINRFAVRAQGVALWLIGIGGLALTLSGCAASSKQTTSSPVSAHPVPSKTALAVSPTSTAPGSAGESGSTVKRLPSVVTPVDASPAVQTVSWEQDATVPEELPRPGIEDAVDVAGETLDCQYAIDLPAALRLAGGNNLQIALAAQRVQAARARLLGASALWLPSIAGGMGYNVHRGRIQDTAGDILNINRSSAFAGGGPALGASPLTGGSNGPARMFIGLPLTDAIFLRLAERQRVQAANAARAATFNDALLAASTGYLELVRAVAQVAIAHEAVTNSQELVRLVGARVRAGTAPPADELRSQAEMADRQRMVFAAEESVRNGSADLVRVLNLQPNLMLVPDEQQPVTIELVDTKQPLPSLIAQGLASRPEMAAHRAVVRATRERLLQEKWRPVIPNLEMGFSAGGFGGGADGFFGDFSGRTDFDALAVWELRNLGFGNAALVRERRSEHRQAALSVAEVRNQVAAEIVRSYYQVRLRESQIAAARQQLKAAQEALPLNFKGILGGQLRAIEALQAIHALTAAQTQYLASIIDYDRAQFELLRALGNPPNPDVNPQVAMAPG